MLATRGIALNARPEQWETHRFGLSEQRWAELRGRHFWITGAGTGYGQCIAVALALAGAQVYLSARREPKLEETRQLAQRMGAESDRLVVVPVDITKADQVAAAAERIRAQTRRLDGLVNNAALPQPNPGTHVLASLDPARWQALFDTNVTGQWLVSKTALPLLSDGQGFRILFMTSEAGWAFTPGFGPYNVSKAALNNLGASLAAECSLRFPDKDIQVNVLVPGEARTEMNQGSSENPYTIVCMSLLLLSHPPGGPNGKFFHRDGRHLEFTRADAYDRSLMDGAPLAVEQGGQLRAPLLRRLARAFSRQHR